MLLRTLFASRSCFLLAACAAGLILNGCFSGQIGGDIGDPPPGCKEAEETTVTVGETIDGTQAKLEDLVALIEGTHETTMAWGAEDQPGGTSVTPAPGTTKLTISIQALEDTGRWVDFELKDPDEASIQEIALAPEDCGGELRVDARVTVTSENGAFDDVFDATFYTTAGDGAVATIPLRPGKLDGNFAVETKRFQRARETQLRFTLAFGLVSGRVEGVIEGRNEGDIVYGTFPADSHCVSGNFPVPDDNEIVDELRRVMSEHDKFNLSWSDKPPVGVTLTPTLGPVCYDYLGSPEEASYSADLTLGVLADDGSIDARWDLQLRAKKLDGELSEIDVSQRDESLYMPGDRFETQSGIKLETAPTDLMVFYFNYTIDLRSDGPALGELKIYDVIKPECTGEPVFTESRNSTSTSSNCESTELKEVAQATLLEAK